MSTTYAETVKERSAALVAETDKVSTSTHTVETKTQDILGHAATIRSLISDLKGAAKNANDAFIGKLEVEVGFIEAAAKSIGTETGTIQAANSSVVTNSKTIVESVPVVNPALVPATGVIPHVSRGITGTGTAANPGTEARAKDIFRD